MSKDHFILTTDYKYGLFSAISSFSVTGDLINSMDKCDLLHSYMVCKIIESLENKDQSFGFLEGDLMESAKKSIKSIIDSVNKNVGDRRKDGTKNSIEFIEGRYPNECRLLRDLISDPEGLVACSFLVPQIINSLVDASYPTKENNLPHLITINLGQFVNAMGHSNESAITDAVNLWIEKDLENQLSSSAGIETLKDIIKQTVQVGLISSGEFEKFIQLQQQFQDGKKEEAQG